VKPSLLGNALEAVIGAIYLDGGFENVQTYVVRILQGEIQNLQDTTFADYVGDFKSRLQEHCQKEYDALPTYEVIRESGPDHQKVFEVQVGFQGKMWGEGVGKTKKEAEQVAAQQALVNLCKE
jgi:ribonuclease-3